MILLKLKGESIDAHARHISNEFDLCTRSIASFNSTPFCDFCDICERYKSLST